MTDTRLEAKHPAPERHRLPWLPLTFGLLVVPALWIVELVMGFAFASYACFPGRTEAGITPPTPPWIHWPVWTPNLVALVLTFGSIAVSARLLARTRGEYAAQGALVETGEGRTRFLASWALFVGLFFIVAIVANTIGMFIVPLCSGFP